MNNEETTIQTGFKELDELTGGFKKGELILIGGRPKMGKTAFALNIALNTALKGKKGAAVFSLEMSKGHLLRRMLCKEAEIDIQCITSGNMQQSTFEKLVNAMIILSEAPIFIDDTGAVFEDIREKCRKLSAADKNLSLVLIDYLQLLGSNGKENRFQNESTILKSLKILAKELDVPFVVLYQLSRRVEERDKKRPIMTDLTYPSMNEIPDKILFLYRDDYYDLSKSEKNGTAEIIVAKNNSGKTGTVNLLFDKEKQKFMNIEENVFVFDKITSISKTSFTAKYGDYWFEINTNGNILYKIKCQNLRRISESLLIAKINNKEGLIDNDFKVVAGFEYSDFKTLDKNFEYFKFRKNNKWGVTDKNGNILIEARYDSIKRADKDFNYMFVTTGEEEFLIDRQENIVDEETTERLICTPEFIENTWGGEKPEGDVVQSTQARLNEGKLNDRTKSEVKYLPEREVFQDSEKPDWRIIEIKGKYGLVDKDFNQLKVNIDKKDKIPEIIVFW